MGIILYIPALLGETRETEKKTVKLNKLQIVLQNIVKGSWLQESGNCTSSYVQPIYQKANMKDSNKKTKHEDILSNW